MTGPVRSAARDAIGDSVLFADAPSGCVVVGADGVIALVNPRACLLFGYGEDELVGRSIELLVPELHRDEHVRHREGYDAAPRVGPMGTGRKVVGRHRDGSMLPVDVRLAPTTIGDEHYVIAFVDDITERVRAQAELDATRSLLEAILEHAPIQVYVKDLEGRYLMVNRQVELESGKQPDAMIGRTDAEIFASSEVPTWQAADAEAIAAGVVVEREEEYERDDGERQVFLSHKFPLLDADGVPYALCGVSTNITARKILEGAVDSARTEAERANRAKSRFLSRVSHELRTPLNSVMGFAQLLQMDGLDPRVEESAEQILRAGRHLLELINDVLDISRIEAGELRLSVEPVRVSDVLAEAGDLIGVQAQQRGLHFTPAPPGGEVVMADRHRLVQVLLNLGSNAVKFNRRGGEVTLAVEVRGDRVRISVRDAGPGISAAARERLFAPFDRLDVDPSIEGTGLGLALSRSLVEAMGGVIDVDSEPGRGSTFWVELPAAVGAVRTEGDAAMHATSATVLYIDDNPESVAVVAGLLRRRPHVRLLTAMQGSIGLDLAAAQPVDLVLVDVHLPDLGGETVLARLRAEPATATIPIVMVSADVSARRARRLEAAGADGTLLKPFQLDALLAVVDAFVPAGRTGR